MDCSEAEVEQMVAEADIDGKGYVSFVDFVRVITGSVEDQ